MLLCTSYPFVSLFIPLVNSFLIHLLIIYSSPSHLFYAFIFFPPLFVPHSMAALISNGMDQETCSSRKESKGDRLDRHQGARSLDRELGFQSLLWHKGVVWPWVSHAPLSHLSPLQSRGNLIPMLVSTMPAG